MFRRLCAGLIALVAATGAAQAGEPALTLPLPCDLTMDFARIDMGGDANWLVDRRVQLGDPSTDRRAIDYAWFADLAGSLTDDGLPTTRHLLMGMHEVTRAQYAAVMDGDCIAATGNRAHQPVTGVTWFDAIAFSQTLTEYLMREAPEALPVEGRERAFLRLPTEAEWEFAARGGEAVSADQFQARTPMQGSIGDYAWAAGSTSCRGGVQPVGLLRPNALGLYDMLGNVEEMTLEPFRLTRGGRLHGQAGGFVARGGSCLTDPGQLHVGLRTEYSYFNDRTGTALAPPFTGFRLVMAAPVQSSLARLNRFAADWEAATRDSVSVVDQTADPADALALLAEQTADLDIRDDLETLTAEVRSVASRRADIERRAVETTLQAAALAIRQYQVETVRLDNVERAIQGMNALRCEEGARCQSSIRELEESADRLNQRRALSRGVYAALLTQTAADYAPAVIEGQRDAVDRRLDGLGDQQLARFADLFARHVLQLQRGQSRLEALLLELEP